jgi:hypothetical protein
MVIGAELFVLVANSGEIVIIAKARSQRDEMEQRRVQNGLVRKLLLELFLFVPASAALLFFVLPGVWKSFPKSALQEPHVYFLLGVASWGFPFSSLKAIVTRLAMRTIQEFAEACHSEAKALEVNMEARQAKRPMRPKKASPAKQSMGPKW